LAGDPRAGVGGAGEGNKGRAARRTFRREGCGGGNKGDEGENGGVGVVEKGGNDIWAPRVVVGIEWKYKR
jgi:hypothetical protein